MQRAANSKGICSKTGLALGQTPVTFSALQNSVLEHELEIEFERMLWREFVN
jgi:hypothetical protein